MVKLIIFILFSLVLIFSIPANAKLLDKIVAIFNEKTITLSMVDRIKDNLTARKSISPQLFPKKTMTRQEIINSFVHARLIHEKLNSMGYTVDDEQVEDRIHALEKQLRIGRSELLNFLKGNNLTFAEYFELIRETIEFNIFQAKVIAPLISITEQQIKNTFYKKASSNKTLSFKYNLVDFNLDPSKLNTQQINNLPFILKKYQASGILPEEYKSIETNVIGDIQEEGLTSELSKLLKKTDEGSFSKPILIGELTHVFFVRKKDLVESSIYLQAKDTIQQQLFEKTSQELTDVWFKRESNKHYIRFL